MTGTPPLTPLVQKPRCSEKEERERRCVQAQTLRRLARRLGISNASKRKKADLYAALKRHPQFQPRMIWNEAPTENPPRRLPVATRRPTNPCGRLSPPPCPPDREARTNPKGALCCYKKRAPKRRRSLAGPQKRGQAKRTNGAGPSRLRPQPLRSFSPEQRDAIAPTVQESPSESPVRIIGSADRNQTRSVPRRFLFFVRANGKSYAIKLVPPTDPQYKREHDVYATLQRPRRPFRPESDLVRMADSGIAVLRPFFGSTQTLTLEFEPGVRRTFEIPRRSLRQLADTFIRMYRAKESKWEGLSSGLHLLFSRHPSATFSVRYLVTEMHEGYLTLNTAMEHLEEVFASKSREHYTALKHWSYSVFDVLVRAHIAHGFSHYDLHPDNILVCPTIRNEPVPHIAEWTRRIRAEKIPACDVGCRVRLFDFDLAFVPTERTIDDPMYHLWAFATLGNPGQTVAASKPFEVVGLYYDLACVLTQFYRHESFDTNPPRLESEILHRLEGIMIEAYVNKHPSRTLTQARTAVKPVFQHLWFVLRDMLRTHSRGSNKRWFAFVSGPKTVVRMVQSGVSFPRYA